MKRPGTRHAPSRLRRAGRRRGALRLLALLSIAAGLALGVLSQSAPAARADEPHVAFVVFDGAIDEVSRRYITRAISKAEDDGATLFLLELDTPGGRIDSMRDIVEGLLSAEVPTAVYVSPRGAQAASAGTFVTAAANVAAMAPGTNIGAAAAVDGSGGDLESTLARKIDEDGRALVRAIADERGRNAAALEETVSLARAYSANEAVELGVADLVAGSRAALLAEIDGRVVETAAGERVIETAGLPVREIGRTLLEDFLTVIADPTLAAIFVSLGSLAIIIELWTPGTIGPGILGVLLLVLAFASFGALPTNWAAVGLLLFGFVLLFFELEAPGLGAFGVGGAVAVVFGLLFLFGDFLGFGSTPAIPEPTVEVNRWVVWSLGAVLLTGVLGLAYGAREGGSPTGYPSGRDSVLVGRTGVVVEALEPSGLIALGETEYRATAEPGARALVGDEVTVVGAYGEVLKVAHVDAAPPGRAVGWPRRLASTLRHRLRRESGR